jgi:multiple sugar transport system permease protein
VKLTMQKRQTLAAWLFLIPSILGFLVVRIVPTLSAFVLSVLKLEMLGTPQFVGLENYKKMFADKIFWGNLGHTIHYVVGCLILHLVFGLLLAIIFNGKRKGMNTFKTIYFIPNVIPWAAVALVWSYLLAEVAGPINIFLNIFGIPNIPWLISPDMAMNSIIIVSVWKTLGYTTLILLGGLSAIDDSFYDAAYLFGANEWQKFRYVTFPLLSPTIFFVVIIQIISAFQIFDPIYVMTLGGPAGATQTIGYYIYANAFKRYELGYASAMAVVLFAIVMFITMIQWIGQKKWVNYD